ncbi:MAG: hypothetical protein QXL22_01050 [Candidatus Nezhaarchaeales archaeon]
MSRKPPVIRIPVEEVRPATVVYRCSRCFGRFYDLNDFVRHVVLKHGIPPSMAWRYVERGFREVEREP